MPLLLLLKLVSFRTTRLAKRVGLGTFMALLWACGGLTATAEDGLRPIRGPIVPGYWEENQIWLLPVLLLVPLLLLGLWLYLRKRAKRPQPLDPDRIFHEECEAMESLLAKDETGEIPPRLSRALRDYIEAKSGLRANEQTREEFLTQLSREDSPIPAEASQRLEEFLRITDEAKFGQRSLTADEIESLLTIARGFAVTLREQPSDAS